MFTADSVASIRLIINVSCRFYFGGTSGFCKGYEHQKQISSSVLYVFLIISAGRRSASGQLPPVRPVVDFKILNI